MGHFVSFIDSLPCLDGKSQKTVILMYNAERHSSLGVIRLYSLSKERTTSTELNIDMVDWLVGRHGQNWVTRRTDPKNFVDTVK